MILMVCPGSNSMKQIKKKKLYTCDSMLSCHLMSKCKFCVPKWNHWYSFRFCQIITSLISLQVNSIRVASNNFLSDLSLKPDSRPGNVTPKSFQPGISEWATFDPVMECLRGGGGGDVKLPQAASILEQ